MTFSAVDFNNNNNNNSNKSNLKNRYIKLICLINKGRKKVYAGKEMIYEMNHIYRAADMRSSEAMVRAVMSI